MGKKPVQIWKLYEVDYNKGTIRRKNKKCPRCGNFMAHHLKPVERWHCGYCGYTEFVRRRK